MIELQRVFAEKSGESLAGAESELVNGRYNNCSNRCYYACFQAAIQGLARAAEVAPDTCSEGLRLAYVEGTSCCVPKEINSGTRRKTSELIVNHRSREKSGFTKYLRCP